METKFIEALNDGDSGNWGKFMVGKFTRDEWIRRSVVTGHQLLYEVGWGDNIILVVDLQTGEGSIFSPHGMASIDLNTKHKIWVCPLFEPFLVWLYQQDLSVLQALPDKIDLKAEFSFAGYRREGKNAKIQKDNQEVS